MNNENYSSITHACVQIGGMKSGEEPQPWRLMKKKNDPCDRITLARHIACHE